MRFGVYLPQGFVQDLSGVKRGEEWSSVLTIAGEAERLGFDSVWVSDHFHTFPDPTQENVFEAFTLLASVAATTERVRLGQMCICVGFRAPSYLAKVTSSIDVISGGRLDVGLGAGWYGDEFTSYGYRFPKASVRIAQLGEAIEILKAMWTEDETWFDGVHYQVRGAINEPKPLQNPHPPLWVAGSGEQRTLRLVAEHADWANFAYTLEGFAHKKGVLHRHCEERGRDPAEIGLSTNLSFFLAETEPRARAKRDAIRDRLQRTLRSTTGINLDEGSFGTSLAGHPGMVVDWLGRWEEVGCEYAVIQLWDVVDDPEALELFATAVMPNLS